MKTKIEKLFIHVMWFGTNFTPAVSCSGKIVSKLERNSRIVFGIPLIRSLTSGLDGEDKVEGLRDR